jgi:hypothetical protein
LLVLSVACIVLLHVLRPGLDVVGDRLSEYANGRYGTLMAITFFAVGGAMVCLGAAMIVSVAARGWWRLAPAALAIGGLGMVLSGLYRTDPTGSGTQEDIHSLASGCASLALIGAALAWSVGGPGRHVVPARVLALVALALGAASPALHHSSWTGLSQRLLWATLLGWLIVTTVQLRPATRTTSL